MGRSKGGFSTKLHAEVDALGNPVQFVLTGGERADISQAEVLIDGIRFEILLADKGYCSEKLMNHVEEKGAKYCVPPKKNSKQPWDYDKVIYKERNAVERFFSFLKQFRRIATRYEKTAQNYLSMVYFASSIILLK